MVWTVEQKQDGELHITALKEDGSTVLWHEAEWQIDADDVAFIVKALSNHDEMVAALERLARLGAGDQYGNSEGNLIAQAALAKVNA